MKNIININDIVETELNFKILGSKEFPIINNNYKFGIKDTSLVYYSNLSFEGIMNNYIKRLQDVFFSLIYGKIISNTFFIYIEVGAYINSPLFYVVGKSNDAWFGAQYTYDYSLKEFVEKNDFFINQVFISEEEIEEKGVYMQRLENSMIEQLQNENVKEIFEYFKEHFDEEALKVVELFKRQLNERFERTVKSMETSINNYDSSTVDSSYLDLLKGSEEWLPLRNSFNYSLDIDNLEHDKGKHLKK